MIYFRKLHRLLVIVALMAFACFGWVQSAAAQSQGCPCFTGETLKSLIGGLGVLQDPTSPQFGQPLIVCQGGVVLVEPEAAVTPNNTGELSLFDNNVGPGACTSSVTGCLSARAGFVTVAPNPPVRRCVLSVDRAVLTRFDVGGEVRLDFENLTRDQLGACTAAIVEACSANRADPTP